MPDERIGNKKFCQDQRIVNLLSQYQKNKEPETPIYKKQIIIYFPV